MLELRGISVRHLRDIHWSIPSSRCVSLSGASGAGKTLLLRTIADLEPFGGQLTLDGRRHLEFPPWEWRRQVGLLPANSQWWSDRVGDHFRTPATAALSALDLPPEAMDWPVARLSSGERQRLAVLRLLANRPRVLLLDEPTANLDEGRTAAVEGLVARYIAETGAAAVWVTHDSAQAGRVSRQRAIIAGGSLQLEPMP